MERRFLKMLRILAGAGLAECDGPELRPGLEEQLRREGFKPAEIARAFEWVRELRRQPDYQSHVDLLLAPPRRPRTVSPAPAIQAVVMTEKAQSFLVSLKDIGVIDDSAEEEALNQLMMSYVGELEVEDVRRTVAIVLFERQFRSGEEYFGIFEEEWKLLFN